MFEESEEVVHDFYAILIRFGIFDHAGKVVVLCLIGDFGC